MKNNNKTLRYIGNYVGFKQEASAWAVRNNIKIKDSAISQMHEEIGAMPNPAEFDFKEMYQKVTN